MQTTTEIDLQLCYPSPKARSIDIKSVNTLAASIEESGLLQPITVRRVQKSRAGRMSDAFEVIAGMHRVKAFRHLKRETIPAVILDVDDLHAELMLIDENLCRNDFTPAERASAQARRKAIYQEIHPEKRKGVSQAAGANKAQGRGAQVEHDVPRYDEAAAEASGQSAATVRRDVHRGEALGDDVLAKVARTSLDKGEELDALAKLPEEKRAEIVDRAANGEKVSAKAELKKDNRESREKVLGAIQNALPDGKCGIVYVDIPRRFNVHSRETGLDRAPENHYPTMTFEEHLAFPIDDIAAQDCILIFWSTAASLIDDIEIMAEWGFVTLRPRITNGKLVRDEVGKLVDPPKGRGRYCSMQVWDKVRMGLGYWFRDRHEFILVGVRGNVVPPAQGTQDQSLFSEEKGEHSAKPDRVAEMIERLWPTIPKIELYRRGAPRPGWKAWGNQVIESEPGAQREDPALDAAPASQGDEPTASAMSPCTQGDGAADRTLSPKPPQNSQPLSFTPIDGPCCNRVEGWRSPLADDAVDIPAFLRRENLDKPMSEVGP